MLKTTALSVINSFVGNRDLDLQFRPSPNASHAGTDCRRSSLGPQFCLSGRGGGIRKSDWKLRQTGFRLFGKLLLPDSEWRAVRPIFLRRHQLSAKARSRWAHRAQKSLRAYAIGKIVLWVPKDSGIDVQRGSIPGRWASHGTAIGGRPLPSSTKSCARWSTTAHPTTCPKLKERCRRPAYPKASSGGWNSADRKSRGVVSFAISFLPADRAAGRL